MLSDLIENIGLENALLLDNKGNLIDSHNFESPNNFSAMSNIIFEMCKELMEDLKAGVFNQLILKSDTCLFVGNKVNDDKFIISFIKDASKLGLLLKAMESISEKLR